MEDIKFKKDDIVIWKGTSMMNVFYEVRVLDLYVVGPSFLGIVIIGMNTGHKTGDITEFNSSAFTLKPIIDYLPNTYEIK